MPCTKRSRTREAPTPTNISTKSEPEMEKNGTPASPATARASRVLPVPGGPTSNTPLGMRPPRRVNFLGLERNSTTSESSSLASSTPATSAKVTRALSWLSMRALERPKLMALPPPLCIWRIKKIQTPMSNSMGNQDTSNVMYQGDSSGGSALISTFFSISLPTRPASCGA